MPVLGFLRVIIQNNFRICTIFKSRRRKILVIPNYFVKEFETCAKGPDFWQCPHYLLQNFLYDSKLQKNILKLYAQYSFCYWCGLNFKQIASISLNCTNCWGLYQKADKRDIYLFYIYVCVCKICRQNAMHALCHGNHSENLCCCCSIQKGDESYISQL